uniref:uncharacterized protein LOC114593904 n=1 Tax=Podarcis muralis TaxID=64176 RepID=UPI00109FDEDF|nr:uncharacterized protein LOC114593904 [Podarcis muralis]
MGDEERGPSSSSSSRMGPSRTAGRPCPRLLTWLPLLARAAPSPASPVQTPPPSANYMAQAATFPPTPWPCLWPSLRCQEKPMAGAAAGEAARHALGRRRILLAAAGRAEAAGAAAGLVASGVSGAAFRPEASVRLVETPSRLEKGTWLAFVRATDPRIEPYLALSKGARDFVVCVQSGGVIHFTLSPSVLKSSVSLDPALPASSPGNPYCCNPLHFNVSPVVKEHLSFKRQQRIQEYPQAMDLQRECNHIKSRKSPIHPF